MSLTESDPLDPGTVAVLVGIVDRVLESLKMANLIQNDNDDRAKHVEWYRGGAQVLIGLKGEIESEILKRDEKRHPSPEAAVERALRIMEDNEVTPADLEASKKKIELLAKPGNFSINVFAPPDPNDEL